MTAPQDPVDFFVSFNKADVAWGEWVSQTLEDNGYSVLFQSWDFRPGQNFVIEMHNASRRAGRTLGLISPDYLGSEFGASEWAAAFVNDPTGASAKFVPVKIRHCQPDGLLAPIIHIDLVGLGADDAAQKLLGGLGKGRQKPTSKVAFPGPSASSASQALPARTANGSHEGSDVDVDWQQLDTPISVRWHTIHDRSYASASGTMLEIELVPLRPKLIEVRKLSNLPEQLAELGRQARFFSSTDGIDVAHDVDSATASVTTGRDRVEAGLMVTRTGQRGGWLSFPRDSMGAVLDTAYMAGKVHELLKLLTSISIPASETYAVAMGVTDPMMLTINSVSVLNTRTSVTGMSMTTEDIVLAPDDYLTFDALFKHPSDISEELVARLESAVTNRR